MDEKGLEGEKWEGRTSRGKIEIEERTTKGEFH